MGDARTAYTDALVQARRAGFALSTAALVQIELAFRRAADAITEQLATLAGAGQGRLDQEARLRSLRSQINGVLELLAARIATITANTANTTVDQVLGIHQDAIDRITGGLALPAIAERFGQLPIRAVVAIASRPGGSATFRTLINRNMQDAAPALDTLLQQSIARGVPVERLAQDVAALLRDGEAPGATARYGTDDADVAGLATLKSDARRIARTESLTALREANAQALDASPVVSAMKWQPSGRHGSLPMDECDILATQDLYGLGKGYYPTDKWPLAPHPNCMCTQGGPPILRPPSEWLKPKPRGPELQKDLELDQLDVGLATGFTERREERARSTLSRVLIDAEEIPLAPLVREPPAPRAPTPPPPPAPELEAAIAALPTELPPLPEPVKTKAEPTKAQIAGAEFDSQGKLTKAGNKVPASDREVARKVNEALEAKGLTAEETIRRLVNIPDDWKLEVNYMRYTQGSYTVSGKPELSITADIVGDNFTRQGQITRTLILEEGTARHDYLKLTQQGAGVGKKLLKSQADLYDDLGITKVEVHANIDVGGYAWARYGFVPSKSSWESLQNDLQPKIENEIAALKADARTGRDVAADLREMNRLLKLASNSDPRSIRLIAQTERGKQTLLGSDWEGTLDLSDPVSRAMFDNYVNKGR